MVIKTEHTHSQHTSRNIHMLCVAKENKNAHTFTGDDGADRDISERLDQSRCCALIDEYTQKCVRWCTLTLAVALPDG